MRSIPNPRASPKMRKVTVDRLGFAPSSPGASIGRPRARPGECGRLWCGGHRWPRLGRLPGQCRGLLTRKFRVAIHTTIGSWPFDCAFRDLEIETLKIQEPEVEQTIGSPFVAWHVENVAASFTSRAGDRRCRRVPSVVQPDQGLWVHQAGRRGQGRDSSTSRRSARADSARSTKTKRLDTDLVRERAEKHPRENLKGLLNFRSARS